jgi:hypothetical protein
MDSLATREDSPRSRFSFMGYGGEDHDFELSFISQ